MSKTRGRWRVLVGIDYRVGDGWKRAEPGAVIDDLDDVTEADFAALVKLGAIEPARARRDH